MTKTPDSELLEQFSRHNSDVAFTEIVNRHVGLVHSVALRHTGNPHHAQDITQAVFIILARKAGSLGRNTIVPGWLYHTARLTAANFQRSESRRMRREQEAYMQSTTEDTPPDAIWRELSPLLDDTMAHLGTADRDALVLRYFQNKTLPEVGAAMGLEGRAAQKRVSRALEKLRKLFSKRGVALSATLIAGSISANATQAAPVGLAKAIATVGIAKGAATASTTTLVKGALKLMAWTKAKTVIAVTAGILLAGGTATVVTTAVARKVAPLSGEEIYERIWSNPNSDSLPLLDKAPRGLVIRPTGHPKIGGGIWGDDGRGFWVNDNVKGLIGIAYDWNTVRTVYPADMPPGSFDVIENLPKGKNAPAFKAEIEKQFGLVAHPEVRETDVLLVTVKDKAALDKYLAKSGRTDVYRSGDGHTQLFHFKNARMSDVTSALEGFFGKPMINRSGSSARYTFDLHWDDEATGTDRVGEILREQLARMGIETAPGREQVKMLVVEPVHP